jgi:YHS domain-containing protein
MIRTILVSIALGAAALSAAPASFADKAPVYTNFASDLAVGGYDPVAYFKAGKPMEGSKSFVHDYKGAKWRFASAENLAAFKANPDAYGPQYGGYCAWAAAQGYTAKGDPKNWKVVNGKLYLNYNGDIQAKWEKDVPGFIVKADANWPAILKK